MHHAYFGELASAPTGVEWSGEIAVDGSRVDVWLTTDIEPTAAQLDTAATFLREVHRFDRIAREAVAAELEDDDSAVALYVTHHLAELSDADLAATFGTSRREEIEPSRFLVRLMLDHVGLRPDDPTYLATFDYTLDRKLTQYVLAVTFDQSGEVVSVEMES